jgi:hypothetical protein
MELLWGTILSRWILLHFCAVAFIIAYVCLNSAHDDFFIFSIVRDSHLNISEPKLINKDYTLWVYFSYFRTRCQLQFM